MSRARLVSVYVSLSLLFAASSAGLNKVSAGSAGAQGEGRIVRPQYGGFDVEVLVGGGPLEVLYGRGRSYVEAREGAEYDLLLRNPLPVRVAVALSVDGLNTIDARRTSAWEASKWVIEPYGTIRISGWQMNSRRSRHFYFTTERDSYAARIGRTSDLGVVNAVFYREAVTRSYNVTPPPPPYDEHVRPQGRSEAPAERESRAGSDAAKSRGSGGGVAARPRDDDGYAATGIGRSVEHDVEWIQMRLERGPAAEVTIRYEYHDALVRLGLLPRPWHDDSALRRRERARGFEEPAYCPEPR